jgi:hypothetical protein
MNAKSYAMIVVALVVGGAVQVAGQQPAEIAKLQQDLQKQFQETADAFVRGDKNRPAQNWAEDYTLIDHYGDMFDRKGALELLHGISAEEWKIDEVTVRPIGELLIVTSRTTAKAQGRRGDLTGQYRVTGVFRNRDGRWENVLAQYTKISQK